MGEVRWEDRFHADEVDWCKNCVNADKCTGLSCYKQRNKDKKHYGRGSRESDNILDMMEENHWEVE